ncbi:hypothetical protein T4C_5471 [Trichinella pseudospiralis]|uniref:Uncharacterized protein n=1 Tax=Trichinella pseudospiralis TaxID=6337 RepID=A0A0V1GIE2_TRIPS|nr:hypothetical protein T4C_5471 [Trichinella pseudospiralis]
MEHANTYSGGLKPGPASAHEKGPTEEFIRPRDRQHHFHRTTCELKSLPRTSEGLLRRYAQQRYDSTGHVQRICAQQS